jgi:hypothetical protein
LEGNGRPKASPRPESEIFSARFTLQRQLRNATGLEQFDWERITTDAVFRSDLIAALFDLYCQEKRRRLTRERIGTVKRQAYDYSPGLDGSQGNSGSSREFDPTPWL